MMTLLSLGAGVQSSTMALMAARGEITPMPKGAIFADTGAEPRAVYDWLDWLETQLPFPVYRVANGSLRNESLTLRESKDGQGSYVRNVVPAYTVNPTTGDKVMLLRKCTADFKIAPINRKVRELVGLKKHQRAPKDTILAEQWIGISLDEIQRMKEPREAWLRHRWPLVEMRMTRGHCLEWMAEHGYPQPPRSACTFCPYHSNAEWRHLKESDPEGFADAVLFEKQWNAAVKLDNRPSQIKGEIFLHRSCVPLDEADLSDPAENQITFSFMDECDGMCGM